VKGDARIRSQKIKQIFSNQSDKSVVEKKLFKLIQLSFQYIALDSFVFILLFSLFSCCEKERSSHSSDVTRPESSLY
jgi:hypothetical protein